MVERFLKHIKDPLLRQLAESAVLTRQLNQDIITCLFPKQLPKGISPNSLFNWLIDWPFVQKRGRHCYEEIVTALQKEYKT